MLRRWRSCWWWCWPSSRSSTCGCCWIGGRPMPSLQLSGERVAASTVAIAIPLALMAAFVFSRFAFPGGAMLLVWVLATQFIPPVVVSIPFFRLFRDLGLIDTRQALVILNLAVVLPYAIWMLK